MANNVDGLRLSKTVNGQATEHVWDGNKQIIADVKTGQYYDADCYLRGTNLVATYSFENGERTEYTYFTQNKHADVVNLTDGAGAVIKSYTYDAFGIEQNIDETDSNAFRYCGEYYDTETDIIYLRARYYSPATGRFISRDSETGKKEDPLSLNLYTYCANNPIFFVDPTGHSFEEVWENVKSGLKNIGNFLRGTVKNTGKELAGNSSAFAIAGTAVAADGPAPIGDVGAIILIAVVAIKSVAVGAYQESQTFEWIDYTSQAKTKEQTKDVAIPDTKSKKTYSYYMAQATHPGAEVHLSAPLTFERAKLLLDFGGDVYAVDAKSAETLCDAVGGGHTGPTNDGNSKNAMHYHPISYARRGHCFYGIDPNLKFIP